MGLRQRLSAVLFLSAGLWWFPGEKIAAAQTGPARSETIALFTQLDRNGDGFLTAEEVGREKGSYFRRLLRLGDANGDERLSRDEFLTAAGKKLAPADAGGRPGFGSAGGPGRFGGLSFDRLDRNRDGRLSTDEIPAPLRPRLQAAMKQLNVKELRREDFDRVLRTALRGRLPFSREAFNRLDRNRDGKLTLQEIPERVRDRFRPLFDRLKKEGLTFDEIAAAVRMNGAGGDFRRRSDIIFRRLDTNRDGKLTLAEIKEEGPKRFLRFLLQRSGKGAEGHLTKEEFADLLQKQQAAREALVRGFMRRLDKNRDGVISRDEADGKLKENFDRIDRNQNGRLEPAELANARGISGRFRRQKP